MKWLCYTCYSSLLNDEPEFQMSKIIIFDLPAVRPIKLKIILDRRVSIWATTSWYEMWCLACVILHDSTIYHDTYLYLFIILLCVFRPRLKRTNQCDNLLLFYVDSHLKQYDNVSSILCLCLLLSPNRRTLSGPNALNVLGFLNI